MTNTTRPAGPDGPSGPRAGFGQRFLAALIDAIILGAAQSVLIPVVDRDGRSLLGILVSVAYFTYLEGGPGGQTLGKKVMGIRVVDIATGESIGYGRAAIRWLGRAVSAIPLLLGYFWMLWDRERQTWHDKFAGSVVIPQPVRAFDRS